MDEDLMKKLHALAQMDRDAVSVYGEALPHVKETEIKDRFMQFANEHQRHVEELSAALETATGMAPQLKVDAMGMVAEWITSFRSMLGEKGPLHAMHSAEKYHNSHYKEAASWDVGDEALAAKLQEFYGDEQEHLSFIDQKLTVSV